MLPLTFQHIRGISPKREQELWRMGIGPWDELEVVMTPQAVLFNDRLNLGIQCNPEVEFERILSRGREAEKSITIDYLTSINNRLDELISTLPPTQKVFTIDSGRCDFVHDPNMKALIVEQLDQLSLA